MRSRTRDQHLFDPGPKRILALDGGGIRGVLTLAYLERIEQLLRDRQGAPALVLSDYFDLIGGTSTGAIIAAGLAKGYSVAQLQELYRAFASDVFQRRWWRRGLVFAKYRTGPLRQALDDHFGDYTLGDDRLRTGLMIMAKRWDTGSPWVIHNNPRGTFFGPPKDGSSNRDPNSLYSLAKVVRASTAAPTFFRPEMLRIATGVFGRFVDGGVSPHNNPALQLLLLATLKGFRLMWPFGADKLLLISVGTGIRDPQMKVSTIKTKLALYDGITSLAALMDDCTWLNQTILQWLSESSTAWHIDSEVGSLSGDVLSGTPLLTYHRYNVWLTAPWLEANLGIALEPAPARRLSGLDDARNVERLEAIGTSAAAKQIDDPHFPPGFDLPREQSHDLPGVEARR